jgi:hypothetical protein
MASMIAGKHAANGVDGRGDGGAEGIRWQRLMVRDVAGCVPRTVPATLFVRASRIVTCAFSSKRLPAVGRDGGEARVVYQFGTLHAPY